MRTNYTAFLFIFISVVLTHIPIFSQSYVPERNNSKIIVQPIVPLSAYAFNLKNVRLLSSPFKKAMDLDAVHLLEIEADRLLNRFHFFARLEPKAPKYGGWESETLSGHSLGHYLSACSMMYAASGDARFKDRVDYIVDELKRCQEARKTGYIGAIPKEDSIWWEVSRGNIDTKLFSLNGTWSPWYVQHKIMAGLLDAYIYCDNYHARDIVVKFADWVDNLTKKLTDAQIQKMLFCEFGGMNETLVNTYAITGEKRYLDISYRFHHKAIVDSLALGFDILTKKHSNTQIPKLIGSIRRYQLNGDMNDRKAAEFFYNTVTKNHTYATGGNSDGEYFGEAGKMSERLSDHTTETCNTYNMLKLNRHLFCLTPSVSYADFYERALYNHILASQHSETGMVCYFTPLRAGGKREYGSKFDAFWCCTGSGMENHVKYGESIFYESRDGNSLYVNTFIPSELNWRDKNATIRLETQYPYSDKISLTYEGKTAHNFTMLIRKPAWVGKYAILTLNGQPFTAFQVKNGYFSIDRRWNNKDKIEVTIPMPVYTEGMPDNPNRLVFKYGPLVLAGVLDKKLEDPINGVPILLPQNTPSQNWLTTINEKEAIYKTTVAKPTDFILKPFNTVHNQHYIVYWDVLSQNDYNIQLQNIAFDKKRQADIEESTLDKIDMGDKKSRESHNFKGDKLEDGESYERHSQSATRDGWLSFDMAILTTDTFYLMLQYSGSEETRYHDIYVENYKIGSQILNREKPNRFVEFFYKIPEYAIKGKTKVNIRIQALSDKKTGGVFEARITRKTF